MLIIRLTVLRIRLTVLRIRFEKKFFLATPKFEKFRIFSVKRTETLTRWEPIDYVKEAIRKKFFNRFVNIVNRFPPC